MKPISTKRIAMAGLLAALTMVGSRLRIVIPIAIGGTTAFHLGNTFCALSGILLGPWLGGLAAGLGSALFDMTNPAYISECWITFLTKGAYGLMAGLTVTAFRKKGYLSDLCATLAGAMTYALLYLGKAYFYDGLLLGGLTADAAWIAVGAKLPATVFNAAVAVIFAPILSKAIRKALEQNRISLE